MSEENMTSAKTASTSPGTSLPNMPTHLDATEAARRQRLNQLTRGLQIAAGTAIISYVLFYFLTDSWQMLGAAGAVFFGLLCMILARQLTSSGRLDLAGYLTIMGVLVAYGGSELVWSGLTVFTAIGGVLLVLLLGPTLLPQQWFAWLLSLGAYGLAIFLINTYEPVVRFDTDMFLWLRVFVPGITVALFLLLLWQFLSFLRRGTIRERLVTSFVFIALLTAAVVSAISIFTSLRDGRQQVFAKLESVVTLKEQQLARWTASLQDALGDSLELAPGGSVTDPEMLDVVKGVLRDPRYVEDQEELRAFLLYNFERLLEREQLFEAVFLMDADGRVILSTDPAQQGKILNQERFFIEGGTRSYVQPPSYSPSLEAVTIHTSRPIINETGNLIAVLAGRANMDTLSEIMRERAGLGETGETYLVGTNNALLTASRFVDERIYVRTLAAQRALDLQASEAAVYEDYRGERVFGVYHWTPELEVALLAEQDVDEALAAVNRTIFLNVGAAAGAVGVAVLLSLTVSRSIGNPLAELVDTATQIAAGDLDKEAAIRRQDEVGALARAFNVMTQRLREFVASLESRVQERTQDLEERSEYLRASAEVGQVISSILDSDELIQAAVDLIQRRFDFYYVGLFLLEETETWAVLQAGTGEAGREMIARKHKLHIGGDSMIGRCVAENEARIALDVGEAAVRFENPLLPETHSEAALPLRSRGQVLGALTVQSSEPAAFQEDTVNVLQTMADQLATALDNARLFAETEETVQAMRRVYQQYTREAWSEIITRQAGHGYRSGSGYDVREVKHWEPRMTRTVQENRVVREESEEGYRIMIPITVRDTTIAVIDTYKPHDAGDWTAAEVELLTNLAEEMGTTLESARLYQDTQRQAAEEQLLSEITAQFTESLNLSAILQAAVQELGQLPNVTEASVHLSPAQTGSTGRSEISAGPPQPQGKGR